MRHGITAHWAALGLWESRRRLKIKFFFSSLHSETQMHWSFALMKRQFKKTYFYVYALFIFPWCSFSEEVVFVARWPLSSSACCTIRVHSVTSRFHQLPFYSRSSSTSFLTLETVKTVCLCRARVSKEVQDVFCVNLMESSRWELESRKHHLSARAPSTWVDNLAISPPADDLNIN